MPFDFCILGAGLAGLTIADKLADHGLKVAIVDPNSIAGGASGVPVALVNPATGRYSSMAWNGVKGYNSIVETLEKIQSTTSTTIYTRPGIIRPAPNREYAEKMRDTFIKTNWPKGWVYWLEKEELQTKYPNLGCVDGGIWLPLDLNVYMPRFLEAYKDYLVTKGVRFYLGNKYKLDFEGKWRVLISNGEHIQILSNSLITAAGINSKNIDQWSFLPLHPVKGQVAIIETDTPFPYQSTVYNSGYALKYGTNKIIAGSTYEHTFEHTTPDQKGKNRIIENLKYILPDIENHILNIELWSGIRASTPNRLPILGRHPHIDRSFIFTGFGSKGLLFSSYLSGILADYILYDKPIPEDISMARLGKYF